MAGYSPGPAAALATGQTVGLPGDSSAGIGVSGLSAPITSDSGYGAILRDLSMPALGSGSVTLEFWGQVLTIAGKTGTYQLAVLTGSPWNYPGPPTTRIGSGDIFNILFSTSGSSTPGTDQLQAWLVNEGSSVISASYNIPVSGSMNHYVFTITYTSGLYAVTMYDRGGAFTPQTGWAPVFRVTGLLAGPAAPRGGLAARGNFTVPKRAVYRGGIPAARIAAHYQTMTTADSGDSLL